MVKYKNLAFLGYPAHRIGSDSTCWRYFRTKGWKPLKPNIRPNGRKLYHLYRNRVLKAFYVYRLMLLAFVGPCPKGMEACHNDGNPGNDALENLRWDTHKGNLSDKRLHGTSKRGEENHRSKLKLHQVHEIRRLNNLGVSQRKLGKMFGVSKTCIRYIMQGRLWKDL